MSRSTSTNIIQTQNFPISPMESKKNNSILVHQFRGYLQADSSQVQTQGVNHVFHELNHLMEQYGSAHRLIDEGLDEIVDHMLMSNGHHVLCCTLERLILFVEKGKITAEWLDRAFQRCFVSSFVPDDVDDPQLMLMHYFFVQWNCSSFRQNHASLTPNPFIRLATTTSSGPDVLDGLHIELELYFEQLLQTYCAEWTTAPLDSRSTSLTLFFSAVQPYLCYLVLLGKTSHCSIINGILHQFVKQRQVIVNIPEMEEKLHWFLDILSQYPCTSNAHMRKQCQWMDLIFEIRSSNIQQQFLSLLLSTLSNLIDAGLNLRPTLRILTQFITTGSMTDPALFQLILPCLGYLLLCCTNAIDREQVLYLIEYCIHWSSGRQNPILVPQLLYMPILLHCPSMERSREMLRGLQQSSSGDTKDIFSLSMISSTKIGQFAEIFYFETLDQTKAATRKHVLEYLHSLLHVHTAVSPTHSQHPNFTALYSYCSYLFHIHDAACFEPALRGVSALVQKFPTIAIFILPCVLYYVSSVAQPIPTTSTTPQATNNLTLALEVLAGVLPLHRDCVQVVLRFLSQMKAHEEDAEQFQALGIRLLYLVWEKETRVFSKLDEAIGEVKECNTNVHTRLAVIQTIQQICHASPNLGKGFIVEIQKCLTFIESPGVVALAIDALAELCQEQCLDFFVAHKILFPKAKEKKTSKSKPSTKPMKIKKPKVVHLDHELVEEALARFYRHGVHGCKKHIAVGAEVVEKLWKLTLHRSCDVAQEAWKSLTHYPLDVLFETEGDNDDAGSLNKYEYLLEQLHQQTNPDILVWIEAIAIEIGQEEAIRFHQLNVSSIVSNIKTASNSDSLSLPAPSMKSPSKSIIALYPTNAIDFFATGVNTVSYSTNPVDRAGIAGSKLFDFAPEWTDATILKKCSSHRKKDQHEALEKCLELYHGVLSECLSDVRAEGGRVKDNVFYDQMWMEGWQVFLRRYLNVFHRFALVDDSPKDDANNDTHVENRQDRWIQDLAHELLQKLSIACEQHVVHQISNTAMAVGILGSLLPVKSHPLAQDIVVAIQHALETLPAEIHFGDVFVGLYGGFSWSVKPLVMAGQFHSIYPLVDQCCDVLRESSSSDRNGVEQRTGALWALGKMIQHLGHQENGLFDQDQSASLASQRMSMVEYLEHKFVLLFEYVLNLVFIDASPIIDQWKKSMHDDDLDQDCGGFKQVLDTAEVSPRPSKERQMEIEMGMLSLTNVVRSWTHTSQFRGLVQLYDVLSCLMLSTRTCTGLLMETAMVGFTYDLITKDQMQVLMQSLLKDLLSGGFTNPSLIRSLPELIISGMSNGASAPESLSQLVVAYVDMLKSSVDPHVLVPVFQGLLHLLNLNLNSRRTFLLTKNELEMVMQNFRAFQLKHSSNSRLRHLCYSFFGKLAMWKQHQMSNPPSSENGGERSRAASSSIMTKSKSDLLQRSLVYQLVQGMMMMTMSQEEEGKRNTSSFRRSSLRILTKCRKCPVSDFLPYLRRWSKEGCMGECIAFAAHHVETHPVLSIYLSDLSGKHQSLSREAQETLVCHWTEMYSRLSWHQFLPIMENTVRIKSRKHQVLCLSFRRLFMCMNSSFNQDRQTTQQQQQQVSLASQLTKVSQIFCTHVVQPAEGSPFTKSGLMWDIFATLARGDIQRYMSQHAKTPEEQMVRRLHVILCRCALVRRQVQPLEGLQSECIFLLQHENHHHEDDDLGKVQSRFHQTCAAVIQTIGASKVRQEQQRWLDFFLDSLIVHSASSSDDFGPFEFVLEFTTSILAAWHAFCWFDPKSGHSENPLQDMFPRLLRLRILTFPIGYRETVVDKCCQILQKIRDKTKGSRRQKKLTQLLETAVFQCVPHESAQAVLLMTKYLQLQYTRPNSG